MLFAYKSVTVWTVWDFSSFKNQMKNETKNIKVVALIDYNQDFFYYAYIGWLYIIMNINVVRWVRRDWGKQEHKKYDDLKFVRLEMLI